MKRFLMTIFAFILGLHVYAATTVNTTNWDSTAAQKRLNNIAYVIIKKNSLPSGISIKVSEDEDANAYANINKEIYVYKGLLQLVSNDEELAAVMSHEMGHVINGHCAKQTILNSAIKNATSLINANTTAKAVGVAATETMATTKLSRKDEFEADLSAVDLMVKSGYNPLALISLLGKICDINTNFDLISTHPAGEKRLMNTYNYIEYNYPQYLKNSYNTDSYKAAYSLIKLNVDDRNSSEKKIKKYKKEQEKLKKEKLKRAKKMLKDNNGWSTYYSVLQSMSSNN